MTEGNKQKTETLEQVKERPILFQTPMVQAVLDDRKDITRRMSGLEVVNTYPDNWTIGKTYIGPKGHLIVEFESADEVIKCVCPYGKPGDILWVRETWAVDWEIGENSRGEGPSPFFYKATDEHPFQKPYDKWKPSIHMPRAACRLRLEIKSISVERLQDISEEDAIREGVRPVIYRDHWEGYFDHGDGRLYHASKGFGDEPPPPDMINPMRVSMQDLNMTAKQSFRYLWQSINGPDSWSANPWTWRIEFSKL